MYVQISYIHVLLQSGCQSQVPAIVRVEEISGDVKKTRQVNSMENAFKLVRHDAKSWSIESQSQIQ